MRSKFNEYMFLWKNITQPHAKVTISLGNSEDGSRIRNAFNHRSWKRLFIPSKKYNCSVIDLSVFTDFDAYLKTVKGKNSADYFRRRSMKLGYEWRAFDPNQYIDAIFNINTSSGARQGREMDANYKQKVAHWPNDANNIWIGVFNADGNLFSYVWLVFANELILTNRILGNAALLKDNIMYLNILGAIEYIFDKRKNAYLMYDTFGRKPNGLVLFKKRIGFKPYTVKFI